MTNPNGRVLYEGPSLIDGEPIVVIATGFTDRSGNGKTGAMIQTWILRQDVPPHVAFKNGQGRSVCGDCRHAGYHDGSCYVLWFQAPLGVWNCWHHGAGYAPAKPEDFTGVTLRLGSAGDPCAVPEHVWTQPLAHCATHTGYTHQWRNPIGNWARGTLQASCDGLRDFLEASAAGWNTFLVTPAGTPDPAGTVHCAASAERGYKTTCAQCHLCDGATTNVVIHAHGRSGRKVALVN